ncbi:hypothetical protein ABIE44_001984 [Marmoricola sp. OAE513]|uniref:hypothetical protein n=1 Tax=Marmoricola sp. OAE513 TaxID=2817894 RepID=UPI001AE8C3E0
MPTARSWTDPRPLVAGARDLQALLQFRRTGMSVESGRRLRLGGGLVAALTVASIVVPAYLREPLEANHVGDLVAVLPTLYLSFAVLAALAAIGSGGGREVVPRDQLVAFPVSAVTEHLGALLLAPLNIAWLLQAWTLLGTTSYVLGPDNLLLSTLPVLVWIVVATAIGQLVGWTFEGIRRGVHGIATARALVALAGGGLGALVLTDRLTSLLDHSPTVRIYLLAGRASGGDWGAWTFGMLALLALGAGVVLAGLVPARWALLRPMREEVRLESGHRRALANPTSDLVAMVRIDRASIWRAVPLRRGLLVLGLMPGAVALAGALEWHLVTILPGLVASGGALLFGVNAWCLDGRGALWRDSLPADPRIAFAAKVVVLFEVLVVAAALTIVLAGVRAGVPTSSELAAVLAATVVVSAQVVASALHWSVASPYAVDLRSARATPAPPVVMASYSSRLALRTTLVGLVFSLSALSPDWRLPLLLAVPFGCWSAYRLLGTARAWAVPETRSRVIAVVAS